MGNENRLLSIAHSRVGLGLGLGFEFVVGSGLLTRCEGATKLPDVPSLSIETVSSKLVSPEGFLTSPQSTHMRAEIPSGGVYDFTVTSAISPQGEILPLKFAEITNENGKQKVVPVWPVFYTGQVNGKANIQGIQFYEIKPESIGESQEGKIPVTISKENLVKPLYSFFFQEGKTYSEFIGKYHELVEQGKGNDQQAIQNLMNEYVDLISVADPNAKTEEEANKTAVVLTRESSSFSNTLVTLLTGAETAQAASLEEPVVVEFAKTPSPGAESTENLESTPTPNKTATPNNTPTQTAPVTAEASRTPAPSETPISTEIAGSISPEAMDLLDPLYQTSSIPHFVNELMGLGIETSVEDVLKNITQVNKDSYSMIVYHVDSKVGGVAFQRDYVLATSSKAGKWESIKPSEAGFSGIKVGMGLSPQDGNEQNYDEELYRNTALTYSAIYPQGVFEATPWDIEDGLARQQKNRLKWSEFAYTNSLDLYMGGLFYQQDAALVDAGKTWTEADIDIRIDTYLQYMKPGHNINVLIANEPVTGDSKIGLMRPGKDGAKGYMPYEVYGENWPAKVTTRFIVRALEKGLVPGKDFSIIIENHGPFADVNKDIFNEDGSIKNDTFPFQIMQEVKTHREAVVTDPELLQALETAGLNIEDIQFKVGLQSYLGRARAKFESAVDGSKIDEEVFEKFFKAFAEGTGCRIDLIEYGNLHDGQVLTPEQRLSVMETNAKLITAAKKSGVVDSIILWSNFAPSKNVNMFVNDDYSLSIIGWDFLSQLLLGE